MTEVTSPISTRRLAAVLGLLACVWPFAIDRHLPARPAVGKELGALRISVVAALSDADGFGVLPALGAPGASVALTAGLPGRMRRAM